MFSGFFSDFFGHFLSGINNLFLAALFVVPPVHRHIILSVNGMVFLDGGCAIQLGLVMVMDLGEGAKLEPVPHRMMSIYLRAAFLQSSTETRPFRKASSLCSPP